MEQMHARRLLSHAAATVIPSPGPVDDGAVPRAVPFSSVDSTVIMILSLLLCVLIVALVLHAFVRCAFRVTRHVCHGQEPPGGEASTAPPAGKRTKGGALPTVEYCSNVELAVCSSTECAICLAEFRQGERVRVLPRCNHGFHARCIGRWLAKRQTCPTCRRDPFAQPAPAPAAVQLQVHADAGQQWTTSLTVQC